MRRAAVCLAALMAFGAAEIAAAKTGTPGPDYFVGAYDIIGQTAERALISGIARIEKQGQGLLISQCAAADISLGFGPAFEVVNLMTGSQNGDETACLFHNNGYNRPIITCRSAAGAAYTLWARDGAAPPCVP
jgi:hypothetical protein